MAKLREAVKSAVVANRDYAVEELRKAGVRIYPNEGTYLLWLDLRYLGLSSAELEARFVEQAKVRLNAGTDYGPRGDGFLRLNLAAPRALIEEGVQRMVRYLKTLS